MRKQAPTPRSDEGERDRPVKMSAAAARQSEGIGVAFFVKLVVLALANAFGIYLFVEAWVKHHPVIAVVSGVLLLLADVVYFVKRTLPLRYILPGLLFLLVFQIFAMLYTGYIAFTNYGEGHMLTKPQAVQELLKKNERRAAGSPELSAAVIRGSHGLGLAVVRNGKVEIGTSDKALHSVGDATIEGNRVTAVPGWQVLSFHDLLDAKDKIKKLRVPVSSDPSDGFYRTNDGSHAFLYKSYFSYDESAGTLTDKKSGKTYRPNGTGNFAGPHGKTLEPGWSVPVGTQNFTKPFTDSRYTSLMGQVFAWTIVFAVLSVITTFGMGLLLAVVMNDRRIRGQRIYRSFFIVPYAFPAFMSAMLWSGMLNTDFGFINHAFWGGASIPWLTNPWLAKLSVLLVNLWLGFPYMFLICTGALQSSPSEMIESARIDGASAFQILRRVTVPLLLVSVAPLLIGSFALNFNNFNIVYLLTQGGPPFSGAPIPVGHTDLLISMVYEISGLNGEGSRQYGLASALSVIIFLIVGTISVISFRRTRQLEEVN